MRRIVLLALAAVSCAVPSAPAATQRFDAKARALDGDTVAVDFRRKRGVRTAVYAAWAVG